MNRTITILTSLLMLLSFCLGVTSKANSANTSVEPQTHIINAKNKPINDVLNYYIFITSTNEGDIAWSDPPYGADYGEGESFRVVITTSEIYSSLIIEQIKHFGEGAKKLVSIKEVDLYQFAKAFGLRGEISGLGFVRWLGRTSFEFTIHGNNYSASGIDTNKISITRLSR